MNGIRYLGWAAMIVVCGFIPGTRGTNRFGLDQLGRTARPPPSVTPVERTAITAARSSCVTCGNNPSSDATVDNAIYAVMQASSIDPTQIPTNSNPPNPMSCVSPPVPCTGTDITICRQVLLNPAAGIQPAQCGTIVSFQYPFQFYLPFTSLNMQRITLSAQAQSRMEN